jgi:hypothetical protein
MKQNFICATIKSVLAPQDIVIKNNFEIERETYPSDKKNSDSNTTSSKFFEIHLPIFKIESDKPSYVDLSAPSMMSNG